MRCGVIFDLDGTLVDTNYLHVLAWSRAFREVERSKPAPDIFEAAPERTGLRAEDAVAVGDTCWDVAAAQRCGVPRLAFRTGGIGEDELRAAGAAAVYDDPADLLSRLADSPIAPLLDRGKG